MINNGGGIRCFLRRLCVRFPLGRKKYNYVLVYIFLVHISHWSGVPVTNNSYTPRSRHSTDNNDRRNPMTHKINRITKYLYIIGFRFSECVIIYFLTHLVPMPRRDSRCYLHNNRWNLHYKSMELSF